ncbi:MAG: hypothetical protein ABW022_11500 [Actinoplanes sp.]
MTATYPPRTDLRECRLYRFWVLHPVTGEEVLGYIGETGRQPFERLLEHLATQPWFDTVIRWEIDPRVFYGKDAVLTAETVAIRTELPLYNVKKNEFNDGRITPPEAIRQRRQRDAAKGAQRWVHPNDRGVPIPPRSPVVVRRPWKPWQKQLLGWAVAWLVLTITGWIAQVMYDVRAGWWASPAAALVLCVAVEVWARLGYPIRPRTWRKKLTRKRRRRVRR